MQKTSAILVSIVAAVVVVILVVIFLGDKLRRTPDHTIDADWETVKRGELERPPLKWSSTESDWLYLKRDFNKWMRQQPVLQPVMPETWMVITDWLGSYESYRNEPTSIDVVVINKSTGGQYHITGQRNTSGASCAIKFVGNVNWK